MRLRLASLFALVLTLPLASCRMIGGKPDFSVTADALSPAEADTVYVESKPASYNAVVTRAATTHTATPATTSPHAEADGAPAASAQPTYNGKPLPAVRPAAPVAAAPAAAPATPAGTYTVVPGDTLARIARLHRVPMANLAAANGINLQQPLIKPGQQLIIPAGGTASAAGKRQNSGGLFAQQQPNTPPAATPNRKKKTSLFNQRQPGAAAAGTRYRVVQGDTLLRIARKHGTTLNALLKANNLTPENANTVRVGTILTIPTQPRS